MAVPAHAAPSNRDIEPPIAAVITQVYPRDGAVDIDWIPGVQRQGFEHSMAVLPYVVGSSTPVFQYVVGPEDHHLRVDRLTNGTTYFFTVREKVNTDIADISSVSEPSAEVTPLAATPPGAPALKQLYPRDGGARVSWALGDDGGADLTGTIVTAEPGHHQVRVGGTDESATLTGLTNGTTYTVDLQAVNDEGTGPAASGQVTPAPGDRPAAPRNVVVTPAESATLAVHWDTPADDGGSPVTGYTVDVDGKQVQTTGTSVRVDGLDPAREYTPRITATNAAGTGPAAESARPVRPRVTVGSHDVVLSDAAAATLTQTKPTQLIFRPPTAEVQHLKQGDILIVPPTKGAPEGLLREITKVPPPDQLSNVWIVSTRDATLQQALPEAEASLEGDLAAENITKTRAQAPGVRLQPRAAAGLEFTMEIVPNPLESAQVSGRLRGGISVDPHWELSLAASLSAGVSASFTATGEVKASLDGNLAAYFTRTLLDKTLASYTFAPITFTVGPIPVVIVPELSLSVALNATGGVELTFATSYAQTIGGQIAYQNGAWSSKDLTTKAITHAEAGFSPNLNVALEFPVNASFYLYGVAGPGVSLVPYLSFTARPLAQPWAQVSLGVHLDLTFRAKLLDLDHAVPLVDVAYPIWQAGAPFDGLVFTPDTARTGKGQTLKTSVQRVGCTSDAPITYTAGTGTVDVTGVYTAPEEPTVDTVVATQAASADCPASTAKLAILVGAAPPEAATGLTAHQDGTQVQLSWTAPEHDGDAGQVSYAIVVTVARPAPGDFGEPVDPYGRVVDRTTDTHLTLTDVGDAQTLAEQQITFTVYAVNQIGAAPATPPVSAT